MSKHILPNEEVENIIFANQIGCEEALTMVTTRDGQENGISIVQSNKLEDFGFDLNLSKEMVEQLKTIYQSHQHDEIPFYIAGYVDLDKGQINCNQILIDNSKESSEEYSCQFKEEFMKEACSCSKSEIKNPNSHFPIVFVGHNHPKVDNPRENNHKIINNFSSQDFRAAYTLYYLARGSEEGKGINLGMMMVNHIGDINSIIMLNNHCYKLTNINVQENGSIRKLSQEDELGVFTDPESNYDIPVDTAKQNKIIHDIMPEEAKDRFASSIKHKENIKEDSCQ